MKGNYHFIPIEDRPVERKGIEGISHERLNPELCHGHLDFVLENTTQMLVCKGLDENGLPISVTDTLKFTESQGQVIIPGASLKGVIRSRYEAETHSCMLLVSKSYGKQLSKPHDYAPLKGRSGVKACRDKDKLCPACRLFGSIVTDLAWKGKIAISDAVLQGQPKFLRQRILSEQNVPRPKARPGSERHHDYYPGNRLAGRKFYGPGPDATPSQKTHNPDTRRYVKRGGRERKADPLAPKNKFHFSIQYQNLEAKELETLKKILGFDNLRIGRGKAFDWGCCHIACVGEQSLDVLARYQGVKGGAR